jgi:NADH-quinone oxidoreductase subunit E
MDLPIAQIFGVATFFRAFSLKPKGKHHVCVCTGTACHVRGSPRILNAVQDQLGIGPGETDSDLKFSLETVNCLGCCALGPVMEVDGKYHGKMVPAKTGDVLKNYD